MNFRNRTPFYFLLSLLIGVHSIAAPQEATPVTVETVQPQPEIGKTMGFQEWKKNQVFDARMNLDQFKSPQLSKQIEAAEKVETSGEAVENSGENSEKPTEAVAKDSATTNDDAEKLRQLEFNLEIAQGLTIHDYFALYLKNKSKEEMALAIQQLSPDELSELLMAYRKALYGVPVKEANTATAINKNL